MIKGRVVEIAALAAIAVVVAIGGKIVLADLSTHRPFAVAVLLALIVGAGLALRRTLREPDDETRIAITKYVAYVVAALFALCDVLAPAKWVPGSCIAAVEVAIAFDIITTWARTNPAPRI